MQYTAHRYTLLQTAYITCTLCALSITPAQNAMQSESSVHYADHNPAHAASHTDSLQNDDAMWKPRLNRKGDVITYVYQRSYPEWKAILLRDNMAICPDQTCAYHDIRRSKSYSWILNHVNDAHCTTRKYQCIRCREIFTSAYASDEHALECRHPIDISLWEHVIHHLAQRMHYRKGFEVQGTYASPNTLPRDTNRNEYICPYSTCQYSTPDFTYMVDHINALHELATRFVCKSCSITRYRRRAMMQHVDSMRNKEAKRLHKYMQFQPTQQASTRSHTNKRLLCSHCSHVCTPLRGIYNYASAQPESRGYLCPACGRTRHPIDVQYRESSSLGKRKREQSATSNNTDERPRSKGRTTITLCEILNDEDVSPHEQVREILNDKEVPIHQQVYEIFNDQQIHPRDQR